METKNCPLCGKEAKYKSEGGNFGVGHYDCRICGNYTLTKNAEIALQLSEEERDKVCYLLSGISRNHNIKGDKIKLDFKSGELEIFIASEDIPKNRQEMYIKILLYLKQNQGSADINYDTDYPIAYAKNKEYFKNLMEEMIDKDFIKRTDSIVKLTYDGWNIIENLENQNMNKK